MKLFLCDDQPDMLMKYGKLLKGIAARHEIDIALSTFRSGESMLENISRGSEPPDVVYLTY